VNPIGSTLQQRYQILEQLGNTGTVTTYLAVDLQIPGNLQLQCVIHRYELPDIFVATDDSNPTILSAHSLYELSRQVDRLPTVYSYFIEGSALYLVREFIQGTPLSQELLHDRPWTESQLVMLLVDLLEVLQDVERCEIQIEHFSVHHLLRRHLDRKIVLINLPIATIAPKYSIKDKLPSDLQIVGEIAIAAATGCTSADLPLTANHRSHWQQLAPHVSHPKLILLLERLIADGSNRSSATPSPDAYPSIAAAWQAVAKVMSELIVQHQTPIDPHAEIARHVQMLVERGTGFYEIGDCQQAISAYNLALAVDPQCVSAYCGRGNARRYVGDYQGSWSDFDTALSIDPDRGIAYIGRALATCFQYQPDPTATQDFQQGKDLLAHPQTAIEYVMRGTAQAQLGEALGAIEDYNTAIRINPRLILAYNNRGNLRQHLGDWTGAIEDFSIVLEIDSQSAIAYNNRAIVYAQMGDCSAAIADYSRAIALQPDFASVYNNRGNAYCQISEYTLALADYSQAIDCDPKFAVAYSNRGNIYRMQGDPIAARSDYDLAISLDPYLAIAYYSRGICHRQLGNHQAAIDDYTATLNLDPQYVYAYYHRGNARQYLGDKYGAIADYTQTIRYDPHHIHAYYNRAIVRSDIGDLPSAMEDLEYTIQLQPTFVWAYYQRGRLLAIYDRHQSAITDFQRAIELKPDYLDAYYQRGCSRQVLGDLADAVSDFSQTIDLAPDYAPAYYQRAKIYIRLGDRAGAITDYYRAANLYLDRGDSKTYQQILQLLDRLSGLSPLAPP
jgi:tetratricopeptide (TPR) repeat protein